MDTDYCAKCNVEFDTDGPDHACLFDSDGDKIWLCGDCVPEDAEGGTARCPFCHCAPFDSEDDNDINDWHLCFGGFDANVAPLCTECFPQDDRASNAFDRLAGRIERQAQKTRRPPTSRRKNRH